MGIVLLICFFLSGRGYYCKRVFAHSNVIYLLIGIVVYAVAFFGVCLLKRIWKRQYNSDYIMFGATVMLAFILIGISVHYCFGTGWDSAAVVSSAENIAIGHRELLSNYYYSVYPNNILLTAVYAILMKFSHLIGINHGYYIILCYQCSIYAITGYLVYACVSMLLEKKYAILAWCIYVLLVGASPWVVIPYSDSTALFCIMLNVFCCFQNTQV